MKITKQMGEAARRELEDMKIRPLVSAALDRMFGKGAWTLCDREFDTALCLIMAIAGVK